MEVIIALLGLILGFVLGFIFHKMRHGNPAAMGRIILHRKDPDEPPYLLVELYDQPEALYAHRQVLFDITQK